VGSTFTRINVPRIKSFCVPYRSPAVQAAIAAECDLIEANTASARALLTDSIHLLTEYRASLITAALTGELNVTTATRAIPA
jgi:type I restriction enzyme S subunit